MAYINKNKQFYQIGSFIRQRRVELGGISQVKLSEAMGFKGGQYVSNIERGLCSIPPEKILIVADMLKLNVEDIIDKMAEDFKINARDTAYEYQH